MTQAQQNGAPDDGLRRIQGGHLVAEMLRLHDVGPIFGMGGFQLLPFYGAVAKTGLEHHLINDERTGAFAADAWARVTGRVGVCDATLGPGATNLVTGLVESLNAGIPLVVLVGDAERAHAGKNMTQETDQVSILRPACKELLRVERPERIPELVRRAFAIATAGRPGPVVIDLPEDVTHAWIEVSPDDLWADPATTRVPARRSRPDAQAVAEAAALIAGSERPVVLAGGGIHLSDAHAPLLDFAQELGVPVAHTLSGKGAIPCVHELSVGLFGRYSRTANDLIEGADLLIAAGTKLGEIATKRFALIPEAVPLVHIDVEAQELGRTSRPTVGLVGDVGLALTDLLAAAKDRPQSDRGEWMTKAAEGKVTWRAEVDERLTSDEQPINVARLLHELNGMLPDDAIVVADGGFASHWAGLLFDTKTAGRGFIANRGFASIGYGLPGALGAAMAVRGERLVVGLTGDGGMNMVLGELETARRVGAPLVLIIINNAASGYVKALQHVMLGGEYQSSDLTPLDYAQIARAMGCQGIRVEDPEKVADALREAADAKQVVVVDVAVTRDPARMLPGVDNRLEAAIKAGGGRVV